MTDRFDIGQVIRILGLEIRADQADEGRDFDVACRIALEKLMKCKEYENLEEQGLLLRLPCKVGDTVYAICTCEAVDTVLDGTLYGSNGGFGTATGYYCPYELSDKCPHIDADDCDECKNIEAVFEDTIDYINITEYETIIGLHNTNLCVTIDEIGKTVFLTKEEAEQKLNEMENTLYDD